MFFLIFFSRWDDQNTLDLISSLISVFLLSVWLGGAVGDRDTALLGRDSGCPRTGRRRQAEEASTRAAARGRSGKLVRDGAAWWARAWRANMIEAVGMFSYIDADGSASAQRRAATLRHRRAVPSQRQPSPHRRPHLHPPRRPPPWVPRRCPLCHPPAAPHHFTTLVASVAPTASSAPHSSPSSSGLVEDPSGGA